MTVDASQHRLQPFVRKMRTAGLPEQAIATFLHHLDAFLEDAGKTLGRERIEPIESLPDLEQIAEAADTGSSVLDRVVVIKLNGGLGTGMGLDRAKSLLVVREGLTFLDLTARQIESVRRATCTRIPLMVMNSFRTEGDTNRVLLGYPDLKVEGLPLGFRQHRVPKVSIADGSPATHNDDPELEWCPPGHGDLYTALCTSGVLQILLERGIRYAFVSNADNLGAVLEPTLLGHMVGEGIELLLEAADRTAADRKGGHLCRLRDGRLALRESAQCPADELDEFQDITVYRYFNTNNVWLDLAALERSMATHGGVLPLDTIVNRKTVDPRDPSSAPVAQLETAMGSAISLFERAAAVRVPRHRFSPVKNTNDLLGIRSDAYRMTGEWQVVLHPERAAPPLISLDDRFFKMIDDFEARFPSGPPSLLRCDTLTVEGDVVFGEGVRLLGDVRIVATTAGRRLEPASTVTGDLVL